MKKDQDLIVISKTYDLILRSCNHTGKFPRNHRFVLGERIERNRYNLLETLIAAKDTKNRQRLLEDPGRCQPGAGSPQISPFSSNVDRQRGCGKEPADWRTFNTKSTLGGALVDQKKYLDADPLLRAGYEGMTQRANTNPPQGQVRLTEGLERRVQLYENTDKPDEAAKWRKETVQKPVKP